jgi:hypothetical protein
MTAVQGTLGLFAVSKLTGDVFDINTCKRYSFPELERLQKKIMKQTGETMVNNKGMC